MKRMPRFPTLTLALALACAPAPGTSGTDGGAPEDDAAATRAVRGQVDAFLDAFNAGDPQAIAPLYTDDVVEMAPDGPVIRGPAAVVEAVAAFLSQFSTTPTQTATVDEVSVHGDVAFARGTWSVRHTPEGGPEQAMTGKWLTVHRRQDDGSWKISRWIWNQEGTATPAG